MFLSPELGGCLGACCAVPCVGSAAPYSAGGAGKGAETADAERMAPHGSASGGVRQRRGQRRRAAGGRGGVLRAGGGRGAGDGGRQPTGGGTGGPVTGG